MKSFTQIVIIGSTSFTPFMRLQLWERRAIIEDLLDIEIFSAMNVVLKMKINETKSSIEKVKGDIASVKSNIEMQKKFVEESKKNKENLIETKRVELTQYNDDARLLQEQADQLTTVIQGLAEKITDETAVRSNIKKFESFRIKIDSNSSKANSEIKFYETNDTCPKCKQSIQNKDTLIEECNHKKQEYESGLAKIEIEQNKLESRLSEIQAIAKEISDTQFDLTKLNLSISECQKQASKLIQEIQELTNKKPISEDLIAMSKKLIADLERLNKERSDLLDKKVYYDMAVSLLKDSGIKAKIIKQYIPIINKMVNSYLTSMDFFVNFTIDEEFKETIKSRHRDVFSYDNFSEGEKLRIDLALLFTWRSIAKIKNSMNTNLLIIDEIFDGSLDSSGTEEFMKLLQIFGKESNIFLISHKADILQDKFNHVMKFEKKNNFSEIVQ
jgi:DNA repair exonuclease SbcCD ATPase subunit